MGPNGTREKDITLKTAKNIQKNSRKKE
nr:hypothetical protein [Bacillus cereus]